MITVGVNADMLFSRVIGDQERGMLVAHGGAYEMFLGGRTTDVELI